MKRYEIKVACRGCLNEIGLNFAAPKSFCERSFNATCKKCLSLIKIEVRQPVSSKKKLMTRVKLIKHSKKLVRILKFRAFKTKMKSMFGVKHA